MNLFRLILILFVVLLLAFTASAQTDDKPICISQAAANACRDNAALVKAQAEKIAALEESVKARDAAIDDLKRLNGTNVAQLTDRLHQTELQLATKTGELIAKDAIVVRLNAIVDVLLSRTRKKSIGLIAF
jgi:hypothetical protein